MVEPRWGGSRSPDVGAPADATGGYQALGVVETESVRRPRREITTLWRINSCKEALGSFFFFCLPIEILYFLFKIVIT